MTDRLHVWPITVGYVKQQHRDHANILASISGSSVRKKIAMAFNNGPDSAYTVHYTAIHNVTVQVLLRD